MGRKLLAVTAGLTCMAVMAGPATADAPSAAKATAPDFDFDIPGLQYRTTTHRLARGLTILGSCSTSCQVQGSITVPERIQREFRFTNPLLVSNDAIWTGDGSLKLRTGGAGRAALNAYQGQPFTAIVGLGAVGNDATTGEPVDIGTVAVKLRVTASR